MDDLVFVLGFDGIFKNYHQPSHKKELYAAPEEFIGKHFQNVLPPHVAELCQAAMKRIEDSEETQEFEYILGMNDEKSWYNARLSPTKDQSGQKTSVTIVVRNITERKKAEEELKMDANIFDLAADSIFVHDTEGNIVNFNETAYKLRGYTKDEMAKINIRDLDDPDSSALIESRVKLLLERGNIVFESVHVCKNKTLLPVEIHARTINLGDKKLILAVVRDITERKKADEALRSSEDKHRKLFEGSLDAIFLADAETGILIDCNPAALELVEREKSEIVGKHQRVLHPQQEIEGDAARTFKQHQSQDGVLETQVITKTGEIKDVSIKSSHVVVGGRKVLQGVFRDATERKKAEEKLKNLKAFDERIINSLGDALLVIDPDDYRIIAVNDPAIEQSKLKKQDILGKTCYELTHHRPTPCQPPDDICPIQRVLQTNKPVTVEHTHLDENNNKRIVEVSARPVKNPEGKTVIIHIAKDITERKQMETQIQQAEKRYHALFDQTPLGVLIINPQTGVPVEFNDEAHNQLGYSREEFAKLCVCDYKANETPLETRDRIDKILSGGIFEWETKHRAKNGEVRDVVITSQTIELSGKTFLHSIYRDVTEVKGVEAALMESESKYRMLVELAQEGVWAFDNDDCTVYVNSRMAQMLGYSESDMVGKNLTLFVGDPDLALDNLQGCKLGHQRQCEFELIRKDGKLINVNVAASSFQDDMGVCIGTLALVSDITERKKNEEALRVSEQRWATTLRSVGDGVIATDLLGQITFMNRVAEDLTGWSLQEASKKLFRDVFKIVNDQTRLEVEDPVARVLESGLIVDLANNTALLQKDGSEIPIDDSAAPIKDQNGKITGVILVFRDRTERKKSEEKLRESSRRIELMVEKLRVVGGLSRHDVRNKLSSVTGYAYLLKKKHGDQADIVEGLGKMELAVKESMRIFEFAKMYEQLGAEELTYIDVEAKLNEACTLFSGSLPKIINECQGLTVLADSFLRQLFYNFIDNTRKYGKKTTTIRVHYERSDQDCLKMVYEDDGVGVPLENKSHLFKEGFSTGGSTGFGLFLTKKMMDVYGWQIQENGDPGIGVKFVLTIPRINPNGKENFQIPQ